MSLLRDLVAASDLTAASAARNEKVVAISGYLATIEPELLPTAVGLLSGEPKQGRVGVGWAAVSAAASEADSVAHRIDGDPIRLCDVDDAIERIAVTHGEGSVGARRSILESIFDRATDAEETFLRAVLTGGLRQGALAGVVTSAVAKAHGVKLGSVRRVAMLLGDLGEAALIAARDGEAGLAAVGLTVGRAIQPMLASTAGSVTEALEQTGPASIEYKLDGIRIQVHKTGDRVWVFTRNLNDITDRVGQVVDLTRGLSVDSAILDGEVLGGRPYFFDILHADGRDLLDQSLRERREVLSTIASGHLIPTIITTLAGEAEAHLAAALDAGHEGAMVKDLTTVYDAGKRGKGWRKVKPVHTLDLVVLGAEWGHGRRTGWLSNLHLGAREPETGEFFMVGKTFKGLTDALLEWQTGAFLEREVGREGITVFIRPEIVVEIAVDSSHSSTRYPSGLALRFARVRRYRDDKGPQDVDTVAAVRALTTSLPAGETR